MAHVNIHFAIASPSTWYDRGPIYDVCNSC
jgi:hypothetical protein